MALKFKKWSDEEIIELAKKVYHKDHSQFPEIYRQPSDVSIEGDMVILSNTNGELAKYRIAYSVKLIEV